jgi:hypothetical protein
MEAHEVTWEVSSIPSFTNAEHEAGHASGIFIEKGLKSPCRNVYESVEYRVLLLISVFFYDR